MASGDIRLCVGLGNPGEKYKNTRHNIGFMILEKLAVQQGCDISNNKKLYGRLSQVNLGEQRIWTLMPNTFMNDSGKSIQAALNWFNLKPDQLLILVDDIDLPLGKIRMRTSGSSGGHNGLKSTIQHLGSKEFARIRIGIGSPSERQIERKAKTISESQVGRIKDQDCRSSCSLFADRSSLKIVAQKRKY